jgi:hypothetical protein
VEKISIIPRNPAKRIVRKESAGSPARSCSPKAIAAAAPARRVLLAPRARTRSRVAAAHQGSQEALAPELANADP